ncbi:MAG TPA: hypothetical protein VGH54_13335 [Mycobacterium sp.]|jgi:hypothetical protein
MSTAAELLQEAEACRDFDDYRRLLYAAQDAELEERARIQTPPNEEAA